MVFALKRELEPVEALGYVLAQIAGGIAGTVLAHAMFALPLWDASLKVRTGGPQWLAEGIAAFGLVATILAGLRFNRPAIALAGRPLHHRGLLVHVFHVVRKSGGRHRPFADEYVFRYKADRSSGLYCRRTCRCARGALADELAAAIQSR